MSDDTKRDWPKRNTVRARHSILTGKELEAILDHFQISLRLHARHVGRNEFTIRKWIDEDENMIPLQEEHTLLLYHHFPWTRRLRGRVPLPLQEWGIDRTDPDEDAHAEIITKALARRSFSRSKEDRKISRLRNALRAISENPENAKSIADEALQREIDGEDPDADYVGATPAEPFGPEAQA
jgi:hypothetical protein